MVYQSSYDETDFSNSGGQYDSDSDNTNLNEETKMSSTSLSNDISFVLKDFYASFEFPPLPMEIDFPEADSDVFKPLRSYERQTSFVDGEFTVLEFFLHKDPYFSLFYKPVELVKAEQEVNLEMIEEEFSELAQNKIDFPADDFLFYDDYVNLSNLFYYYKGVIQGVEHIMSVEDYNKGYYYPAIEDRLEKLEVIKLNLEGKKRAYKINIDKKKDLKQIYRIFEGFAKAQDDSQDINNYKGFKTTEEALIARHENNKIQAYCVGFLGEIKRLYPYVYNEQKGKFAISLVEAIKAKNNSINNFSREY